MIRFHSEEISFKLKDKTKLKHWITNIIKGKKTAPGEITFVFCTDDYLLAINKQHLNHNTLTDIITFDYTSDHPKQLISGEIYISIDRVGENANKYSVSFEDELHRVMIHGVLHLLEYKDKSAEAKKEMRKQEDAALKKLL